MIIDFDEKKVSMWLYFSSRRSTEDALMDDSSRDCFSNLSVRIVE